MVIDEIGKGSLYYSLGTGIETALQWLSSTELPKMAPGRYELAAGCFALVQDYESVPREEKRWEAHRKYIDVQFIASGEELMGYARVDPSTSSGCSARLGCSELRSVEPYDQTKDIEWFEGEGSFVAAPAGTFVILYPHDAHMPGVAVNKPEPVRKVVVKVPVER